ncbi:MAG TPA: transglycosylase SLT domain-containing protein, partial [Gemmatimonadaceae bacterium]|nr:transglycosylase SLT domain-containing protein [Gemmatimonadaceae bacterium]
VSSTDVARGAADVFGDSTAAKPGPNAPTWDMDVASYETRARVQRYVTLFTGSARDRIVARLERGSRYEAMIRQQFLAGGLPGDLYYLALVESGYDPNAYSKAAAVGMWQFMASTARDLGLRVDWWVDERRDPVKSTKAAVRFIKGLDDQFGSLYLAAAAYDGGPGRIARGLSRYADELQDTQGDDCFFALADRDYLRNETRDYVPQLIAAALVGKDPGRYGLDVQRQQPFTYDSVRVAPRTPLAAIAQAAGTTVDALHELDPQILRGMTPPLDSIFVRIPAGSGARFDSLFSALPESARVATRTVESRKGEYLETIARRHGLSTRALAAFNPGLKRYKSGHLVPGQAVLVPTAAVAEAAIPVPDPSIERYPSSSASTRVHTVRKGETLGGIARRYGTTVKHLMALNDLRRAMIFPGQTLIVSSRAAAHSGTTRAKATKSKAGKAKATKAKATKASARKTTAKSRATHESAPRNKKKPAAR